VVVLYVPEPGEHCAPEEEDALMLAYRSYTPERKVYRPKPIHEAEIFELPPIGKKARAEHKFFQKFVREIIPDFCWQDFSELITMAEALDEDIDVKSLQVSVCMALRAGILESKISTYKRRGPGGIALMYKRRA
jgi:hypothetical protein